MDSWTRVGALVGRVLMAFIFVGAGLNKFANFSQTAGMMTLVGFPGALATPLLILAALIEVVGGIALIVGFRTRIAALVLCAFLIPTTIIFHMMPGQMIHTMKNLAIMGGLLMVATQGAGGLSLDSRAASSRSASESVAA